MIISRGFTAIGKGFMVADVRQAVISKGSMTIGKGFMTIGKGFIMADVRQSDN